MARRHRRRRRRGVTAAIMVNPRHRRRRHFVRRRRNPSGFLGELITAGGPALIGGGALAYTDAAFLSDKSALVRVGIKVALAGLAGLLLRKKHPVLAASVVATVVTAAVMTEVTRMIAASNGKDVAAGKALPAGAPLLAAGTTAPAMKALVREDGRAMGVLIQRNGMSSVLDERVSLSGMGDSNQLPSGTHFQDVNLGS